MPIPKPMPFKFTRLQQLHHAMVETHASVASFKEFKYWIQFYSSKLNPMISKEQYDDQTWTTYLSKILIVQPTLTLYSEYWPVEAYFNFYMYNRRRFPRRKNANRVVEISDDEFELNADNVRNTQHLSVSYSAGKNLKEPHSSDRSMALSSRSEYPGWRRTNARDTSRVRCPSKNNDVADHPKKIISCIKCRNAASVKSIFKKRLVNLVGNADLLSILAKLGIFTDQHLDDLCHLKHDDLMRFFSDVPGSMTPLAKLQFIKSLQVGSLDIQKRKTPYLALPPLDTQPQLPTLIQLPCELHSPIDISNVSQTLQARLHALGIAGLIPALAYIGIYTDAQFADFCKLDDQEKDDLFTLGKLKLSQFQWFMLRLALLSI